MKTLAIIAVSAGLLAAAENTQTFTGVITDSMCGADHKMMHVTPDSKCVTDCVRMSKTVKYVLYDGKNAYTLSDQQTPEKFAARKVKVTGALDQKTKILKVDKIEPAK